MPKPIGAEDDEFSANGRDSTHDRSFARRHDIRDTKMYVRRAYLVFLALKRKRSEDRQSFAC